MDIFINKTYFYFFHLSTCNPGYVSNFAPITTCMEGKHWPIKPREFRCEEAAALILSSNGGLEIFTGDPSCNYIIRNRPQVTTSSQTISLIDDLLVIVGFSVSDSSWLYMSMENTRGGLLANKWTQSSTIGKETPSYHVSSISGHDLVQIGGGNTQANLMTGVLGSFKLVWANSANTFESFPKYACGVKINRDEFIVIGGEDEKTKQIVKTVLKINVLTKTVKKMHDIRTSRVEHGCEVTSGNQLLISGGHNNLKDPATNIIQTDEVITITSMDIEESKVVDNGLNKYQHQMILLKDTIFSIGGTDSSGVATKEIKKYNTITNTWSQAGTLKSGTAGVVAVTAFPKTSVDCIGQCRCGMSPTDSRRIFDGSQAQVSQHILPICSKIIEKVRQNSYLL